MKRKSLVAAFFVAILLYTSVFAQSVTGTVTKNANLRAGPGTNYAVVGTVKQGQIVTIFGKNDAGTWYHLDGNKWIAAFLVNTTTKAPGSGSNPTPTAAPTKTPQPAGNPKVVISTVLYDGEVYRVESDEYAVIANIGNAPANISGWLLNAGDNGQDFRFPNFTLAPGKSVRIYTDEIHPETGGFSFNIHRAIWNNQGDCGYLYDNKGNEVSEYCY